jgi:hypothetical protein
MKMKMKMKTKMWMRTRAIPPDDEQEKTSMPDEPMAEADVPVSDEVMDDDADSGEASEEGGEPGLEETRMGVRKHKKSNQFDKTFVKIFAHLLEVL